MAPDPQKQQGKADKGKSPSSGNRPDQTSPQSPSGRPQGRSDDDDDATRKTAPGKPREFSEETRRKRGQETVERGGTDIAGNKSSDDSDTADIDE